MKSPICLEGGGRSRLRTLEDVNAHTFNQYANGTHNKQCSRLPIPDNETRVFNPEEDGKDVFRYGNE